MNQGGKSFLKVLFVNWIESNLLKMLFLFGPLGPSCHKKPPRKKAFYPALT
jgi:hypothetical protein